MDSLTIFEYSARPSGLYRIDARGKLAALVLLSLVTLRAGPAALTLASTMLAVYACRGPLPPKRLWRGLRWLIPLLVLIAAARGFAQPLGPHLNGLGISISVPGLLEGLVFAWRLVLLAVLGALLTATTAPTAIKSAVTWYLRPVPLVPAARVGTMLALLLRFIPLIFAQARQTLDAQRARGVECRKNPLIRLRHFVLPFFRRTLLTADRIAEAMEARSYSDVRTAPPMAFTALDGLFLGSVATAAGLMLCL